MENFKKLPVIALRSMTILPDTMIHFDLIRKKSILAAEQAMSEDQEVFLVTQCHAETEDPQAEDLYQIGCIAKVKQVTKLPDNLVRVLVEGVCRGRLRTLFGEPGRGTPLQSPDDPYAAAGNKGWQLRKVLRIYKDGG